MSEAQPFTSWVSRVKLLDDFPTLGDPSSDMLGLSPVAESIARSFIESDGKPMVIHVDGAWGRGKTSFCHMLEAQLHEQVRNQSTEGSTDRIRVKVAWYIASDAEPVGQQAVMYQVLRAVLDEDPEEIASLMSQFNLDVDGGNGEPTFDRFRNWLIQELGWARGARLETNTSIRLVASPGRQGNGGDGTDTAGRDRNTEETTGQVQVTVRPQPRKLAVIFIDDLDRCGPQWVAQLLDTMRRYVNCNGVSFVVAADRKVIETAFDTVVSKLGAQGRRSSSDALEKYIRHRVVMPRWSFDVDPDLGNKLAGFQQALNNGEGELPLLKAPTLDLSLGVAFKLALYLPRSLSVRRLKRLLNRFSTDIARCADMADVRPEDLNLTDGAVWQNLKSTPPRFDQGPPIKSTFAAHFFGRLIIATLEEVWPDALDIPLDSKEFEQRIRALQLLGSGIQDDRNKAALSLDLFETVVNSVVGGSSENDQPGIEIKRELCEFIASVYADLGLDGRFVPRRASFHTEITAPDIEPPQQPTPAAPAAEQEAPGPAPPGKQARDEPETTRPAQGPEALEKIAGDLEQLLPVFEQFSGLPLPTAIAWIIDITQQLDPEPPPRIREALRRFAQTGWPEDTSFAVCEFARGLIRLGLATDAYDLLVRLYETLGTSTSIDQDEARAFRWSITEVLSELALAHPYLREKLTELAGFPPVEPPDCAGAWQAARSLVNLSKSTRSALNVGRSFVNRITAPIIQIAQAIPDFAWPAQALLELIQAIDSGADANQLAAVRGISEQIKKDGLPEEVLEETALAAVRVLRTSTSDQQLAIELYDFLEQVEALPASELHSRALLYRDIGNTDEAARNWEQAYRLGELSGAGRREYQLLLEEENHLDMRDLVFEGKPLPTGDHRFGRHLPRVAPREYPQHSGFSLAAKQKPLEVLQTIRGLPVTDDRWGILGEIVPKLLGEAVNESSLDKVRVEAEAWNKLLPRGSRATIDFARGMSDIALYSEARELIRHGIEQISLSAPAATQLTWQLVGAEVEPFRSAGGSVETDDSLVYLMHVAQTPPLGRVWDTGVELAASSHAPLLAGNLLSFMNNELTSTLIESPPGWLYRTLARLLKSHPDSILLPDAFVDILSLESVRDDLGEADYSSAAKTFLLHAVSYKPEYTLLAENISSAYGFTPDEYLVMADRVSPFGLSHLEQCYRATAYNAGERGSWVEPFANTLDTSSNPDVAEKALSDIRAGKYAPDLENLVSLFKIADDPGYG